MRVSTNSSTGGSVGWAVEFDTSAGPDDCAVGDHVAVVLDGDIVNPLGCAATPLADSWHAADIAVS